MAEKRPKAERRKAAGRARASEEEEPAGRKAKRRQARGGRRERGRDADVEAAAGTAGDAEEIEARLARIEDAVASQAERSEALSAKLDEVLAEARKSARHAKTAVEQASD